MPPAHPDSRGRMLDTGFHRIRNSEFGMAIHPPTEKTPRNDREVIMWGSPSNPVSDDCRCRCFVSLTTVAASCRCVLPLSLPQTLALTPAPALILMTLTESSSTGLDPEKDEGEREGYKGER